MLLALECTPKLMGMQEYADFDFALTHLILEDEEYAEYYKRSTKWKILDNSVNEELLPRPLEDVASAAELINPDKIVAPDYLGDSYLTMKALVEAEKRFGRDRVIPVLQGGSRFDALQCARQIASRGFRIIAVPYDLLCQRTYSLERMAAARVDIVQVLGAYEFDWVHLLGMTTLEEFAQYKYFQYVKSVDTGSPILHGLLNLQYGRDKLLTKEEPTYVRMLGVRESALGVEEDVLYNIAFLKGVLSGRKDDILTGVTAVPTPKW